MIAPIAVLTKTGTPGLVDVLAPDGTEHRDLTVDQAHELADMQGWELKDAEDLA